ncbi:Rieske 2Fe-2S domain-containing protein [Candidatus Palauibacter sp.]|uniref:Rieske 2Fe-2S domain-containing protein n=1 Tax=Candidatus Palauibacter sp. TaxID=3101350 RepID=UPI003B02612D
MTTRSDRTSTYSGTLPACPEGWYFVASRETVVRERLIEKTWLGEEIVAWADDEGRICVADAFCPHLGSHMGPSVGGVVRDGCLVCPFHGFEFDTAGQCVATPNAPPPKAARLKLYETREILGMIFAWWGSGGRPAQWRLPDEPPAGAEWTGLRSTTLRFRGHPQETTENSVDVEHLGYTHGYHDVEPTDFSIDGAYLKSCFDFKMVRRIAGLADIHSDVSAITHVHGLGFSFVEIHEKTVGMRARLWVLSTPVDGESVELTLVSQVREIRKPGRFFAGLAFLPVPLRHRLLNLFFIREEKRFVLQDVVIWDKKRYRTPPRLSRTDGPIGKYRRYCRQFYPNPASTTGELQSDTD